jgi:hypothetical protein
MFFKETVKNVSMFCIFTSVAFSMHQAPQNNRGQHFNQTLRKHISNLENRYKQLEQLEGEFRTKFYNEKKENQILTEKISELHNTIAGLNKTSGSAIPLNPSFALLNSSDEIYKLKSNLELKDEIINRLTQELAGKDKDLELREKQVKNLKFRVKELKSTKVQEKNFTLESVKINSSSSSDCRNLENDSGIFYNNYDFQKGYSLEDSVIRPLCSDLDKMTINKYLFREAKEQSFMNKKSCIQQQKESYGLHNKIKQKKKKAMPTGEFLGFR